MVEKIIYALVLAAGLAMFAHKVYWRVKVLGAARSVDRRGDLGTRIAGVFQHFVGQYRLIHGDLNAGLMHALIFWGFLVLLLNTLQFLIGGFINGEYYLPSLGPDGPIGRGYIWVKDLFEVIVLAAVMYAFGRRLITKPKRLKYSNEALLILGLIAILMITDLAMGRFLGLLAPEGSAASVAILKACWWVHLVALLYFMNLLPVGKHFHVLTSIFSVYLRNLGQQGQVEKLDFEDESLEEYGVSKLTQLKWSNWLDGYSCTECGRCDHFCPANQTGKELSPRHIITATRDMVYAHQPYLVKQLALARAGAESGSDGESPLDETRFVGDIHTDQALWACTTCGACDTHCPLFIEHVSPIVEMRRHLVLEEEGRFPSELAATFKGLENQGNPWGIGAHERLSWAEGMGIQTLDENPEAEYIYFVGCMASFDDRSKETARALVQLLNHAGVNFAVLSQESCCGDPARRTGHEYLAQALIEMNVEQFSEAKPKKVFTACPHCFNSLKHEYIDFGITFDEVIHHSELLTRLVREKRIVLPQADGDRSVVFHDSCYLGRYNNLYEESRGVLEGVTGSRPYEAKFNRDKGYCCGAGGGRMFMEESEGERVNQFRYKQLEESGAQEIGVSCPFCLTMLDDAGKELEGVREMRVNDIAVILRDAVVKK